MGKYNAMVVVTYKTTHLSERTLNAQPQNARFLPRLLNGEASGEQENT